MLLLLLLKKEKDLLLKFKDLIIQENADLITGWNTDGFDTPGCLRELKNSKLKKSLVKLVNLRNLNQSGKKNKKRVLAGELVTVEL